MRQRLSLYLAIGIGLLSVIVAAVFAYIQTGHGGF